MLKWLDEWIWYVIAIEITTLHLKTVIWFAWETWWSVMGLDITVFIINIWHSIIKSTINHINIYFYYSIIFSKKVIWSSDSSSIKH